MNNISHKGINKLVASQLGYDQLYDVRCEFKVIPMFSGLTLENAQTYIDLQPEDIRHLYTITSSVPDNYCEDVSLALYAAKRIAEKNQQTFVLSLENGTWKAAYGDWGNCAEYSGSNAAYVTCIAILLFHGKL